MTEWIPCSKALPKEQNDYLVTIEAGTDRWRDVDRWMGDDWKWWKGDVTLYEHIVAWAPIPDVYRGE